MPHVRTTDNSIFEFFFDACCRQLRSQSFVASFETFNVECQLLDSRGEAFPKSSEAGLNISRTFLKLCLGSTFCPIDNHSQAHQLGIAIGESISSGEDASIRGGKG